MEEEKHEFEIEIVFSGNVVEYFKGDYSEFLDPKLDIILCNNALKMQIWNLYQIRISGQSEPV